MSRLRFSLTTSSILLTGLLATGLAALPACGGDDDDTADDADDTADDSDDTGDIDAGVDAGVEMTRTGIVAVTETEVTNPLVALGGPPFLSGAVVSISYVDDQSVTVLPLPDFMNSIGGCSITVYDDAGGDLEPEVTDEGVFTVSGTANGDFACGFDDTVSDYVCQSLDADLAGGVAGNAIDGELSDSGQLTLVGANFGPEMEGMHIQLTGFDGKGDPGDGIYSIVVVPDPETLIFAEPVTNASIGGDDATYTTFVGAGPIPNMVTNEFLDDGTEDVVITKADSDLVPGFTVTAGARGQDFVLTKDSTLPDAFPDIAEDVVYACDGDACGSDPDQEVTQIDALVINGTTTDILPDPLDDDGFTMLPAVGSHATFTCSAIGADEITIPADGVQAILDTGPLRVQVTVGRFVAELPSSETSDTTVVIGHSLTGFTTFEK
ncbi:MAG TPA: hypothetical protein VKB80_37180 [Kofleriaceae bacterium]|nr:hypothetical protein [Kofleriaceae bacterium]